MMKKIILIMFILLLGINFVYAQSLNVCCEKTTSNAWCQNTQQDNCDRDFRVTPTSCESTSFCKPGCCFDSQEGLCMENTPQKVCNDANATWVDDAECNVPQCNLGCCGIGNQASFVTLTRCKRLSNLFGLEVNFKTDVIDEFSCIATAFAQEKGACVFESEFETTCKFTTRSECLGVNVGESDSKPEFFRNFLCSAEEL